MLFEDLIKEINALPRDAEHREQRLDLCKRMLELVPEGENRPVWAWLHYEIGWSLAPLDQNVDRAELKNAQDYFCRARTVYTRSSCFDRWVDCTYNMALLHERLSCHGRDEHDEQAIALHTEILLARDDSLAPAIWAQSHLALSRLYMMRAGGDRGENVELGITQAEQAIDLLDREQGPVRWAEAQDLLGSLYRERMGENPAQDIECALAHHQLALEALNSLREQWPEDWARVQHNLGAAMLKRVDGERQANLALAIDHLEKARTVRTKEADIDWADTQFNLAIAYMESLANDPDHNVKHAVNLLEELGQVCTRDADPVGWSLHQRELGNAYFRSMYGERAESLERTIRYYKSALEVQGVSDRERAATEHNLAVAYGQRIFGQRLDNLRIGIEHAQIALCLVDPRARLQWAQFKADLADMLWRLALIIKDEQEELAALHLEQAIAHGETVVRSFHGQAMSHSLALTHFCLGNAYADRLRGDNKAQDQDCAIENYRAALTFYSEKNYPVRWADTHNNLAVTWGERVSGNAGENRRQAIVHYEQAMTVFRQGVLPANARRAGHNLGNVYLGQGLWHQAAGAYQVAVNAADRLYHSSLLRGSKEAELSQNAGLYRCAAYALACDGQVREAVVALEKGRARLLSDALMLDVSNLTQLSANHPDLYRELQTAVARVTGQTGLEYDLTPDALVAASEQQRTWREKLKTLKDRIHRETSIDLVAEQAFDDLVDELDPEMPLVYLLVTRVGGMALLVRRGKVEALPLTVTDRELLLRVRAYVDAYAEYRQAVQQAHRDKIEQTQNAWRAHMDDVTRWLWRTVLDAPLDQLRRWKCKQAVWVPTGLLGLLPLHAAWKPDTQGNHYAIDEIAFAYAPSGRVFAYVLHASHDLNDNALFAVDNPDGSLEYSHDEVRAVARHFRDLKPWIASRERATLPTVQLAIKGRRATKELPAVEKRNVLHFSCHGTHNWQNSLLSELRLYGRKWTAGDLLKLEAQPQIRLAFLSACETGLPGGELPDEAIGWGSSFLQAGAAGIVSTLWAVEQASTKLLVEQFYENWKEKRLSPVEALAQAQRSLRSEETTTHPYHWAGFTLTGI